MAIPTSSDAQTTLRTVDAAIASSRAAMLTAAQSAQVHALRTRLMAAAAAGDDAERQRLSALILSIIREGPPPLF